MEGLVMLGGRGLSPVHLLGSSPACGASLKPDHTKDAKVSQSGYSLSARYAGCQQNNAMMKSVLLNAFIA